MSLNSYLKDSHINRLIDANDEEGIVYIADGLESIDWARISLRMNLQEFSVDFLYRFKHQLHWQHISQRNKTITTEIAHLFEKEIGSKRWFKDGELHREDGPAVIELRGIRDIKLWFKNGVKHNDNGPSSIYDIKGIHYIEEWYQEGIWHREGGPAGTQIDYICGEINYYWVLKGMEYDEQTYHKELKKIRDWVS